ncbi:hypothetical protein DFA_03014 [Cavenderia fasciculata]|uniref:Uncharacterized protein n=1 Tax=Cavenderia fasciculata TaxID=261658 RepID=F4PGD6_CACFS|nr:uncharacterized protein DFA_03014 [Cavenderia fasciculata]EGG24770.1 hypothetical protein DFA_03014 [Cavenderia fasciculata]|eukprot:XP_004362621.1 hypothetical protein DFA_03014 [Cavenderia fasciculata]
MSGIFNSITETANELGNIIEKEITSSVSKGILKIRTAVSKDKNRFIKDGFNLDLSYITNRIIGMQYS